MKHRDSRHDTTQATRIRFLVRMLGMLGLMGIVIGFILFVPGSSQVAKFASIIFMVLGGLMAIGWVIYELKNVVTGMASQKAATGSASALQVVLALLLLLLVNAISFRYYHREDVTRDKRFTIAPELREKLKQLSSKTPTTIVVLLRNKTSSIESDDPRALEAASQLKIVEKVRDLVDEIRELGPQFNVHVLQTTDDDFDNKLESLTPLIDIKKIPEKDLEAREVAMKANQTSRKYRDAMVNAPENSIFFFANNKMQRLGFNQFYMLDKTASLAKSAGILTITKKHKDRPNNDTRILTISSGHKVVTGSVVDITWADGQRRNVGVLSLTREELEAEGDSGDEPPVNKFKIEGGSGDDLPVDKTTVTISTPADRNLVLTPQGKERFVEQLLALEQKTPKVALLTIHPLLTSEQANDEFSAYGLGDVLMDNGYDVVDIIVKDLRRTLPLATSIEEVQFRRTERTLTFQQANMARYSRGIGEFQRLQQEIKGKSIVEINRILKSNLSRPLASEADRLELQDSLATEQRQLETLYELTREESEKTDKRYQRLLRNDRVIDNLQTSDANAKLKSLIADVDILIIPRLTNMQLTSGGVAGWYHSLTTDQANIIRDFLKAGKSVMFSMGPTNADPPSRNGQTANDDVEKLIAQLGVDLGTHSIITPEEINTSIESGGTTEEFSSPPDHQPLYLQADRKTNNPIEAGLLTHARAVDAQLRSSREERLDEDRRKSRSSRKVEFVIARNGGFRAITVAPPLAAKSKFQNDILRTNPQSWNESRPLFDDDYIPTWDPITPKNPKKNSKDEERKQSYPVGVALERPVPAEWTDPQSTLLYSLASASITGPTFGEVAITAAFSPDDFRTKTQDVKECRVVVYGHGGLFIGKKLDPGRQALLISSIDWLGHKDIRLPKQVEPSEQWHYPRLHLQPVQYSIWRWGTFLGLPMLAAFVGVVVLMLRQLR